ncbi:MAG: right-handed parallel beta-helix repeat-containing protein [Chitinispirillaceae bacterium]|nr:right-handed parallel beta-helix repeat-containing protein [Chitinispirillaceae bacterium]
MATTSLLDITRQLQPDDTVYMRGGSHKYSTTVRLYKSGTAAKRIHVVGYPGDGTVELDFSGNDGVGMVIDASYVNYSGQTFRGARDNGLLIEGNNITISRCTFLENGDSGLQIEGANNTIINCDSYYNKDPGGENADGFAPKLDVGSGNKFIGCRAWQNSDDGWDGYLKSNKDVSQSLENCWAFKNGYLKDGSVSQGNGNGFKPGSDVGKQNWTFKNCLACGNLSKGFDQNHNLGSVTLYNCTAADNKKYDYVEYEQPASGKSATYKNCLQFSSSGVKGLNLGSFVQVTSCSWSGGIEVDASDFESTDLSELTAPRKSDGSLPDIKYLHIKEGSDLIDAGTDVGIAFKGKAPDLGAFESSYTTTVEQENTVSPPGIRVKLTADNTIMAIEYHLPKEGVVKLAVYTLSGKRLFETAPLHKTQGLGADYIDVGSITSGLYICSLILDGVGTTAQAVLR